MPKSKNPWRSAREKAGLTQDEVVYRVRAEFPDDPRYWVTKAKLSRKELGKSTNIPGPALVFIARQYSRELEDLDDEAAVQLRRDLELHLVWAARDSNPEPADGLLAATPVDTTPTRPAHRQQRQSASQSEAA